MKVGYETIADAYTTERSEASEDIRLLREFTGSLPGGGRLLDAGCGGGRPGALILSSVGRVVGIDMARAQLCLLRGHVPDASPVLGDMTRLPFRDGAFDGVVSLYAIIHVPRDEHGVLFEEIHRVLGKAGMALLCLGEIDLPGDIAEYMGVRMFWSHFDAATNRRMLEEARFTVIWERSVRDFQNLSAAHRFFMVRKT